MILNAQIPAGILFAFIGVKSYRHLPDVLICIFHPAAEPDRWRFLLHLDITVAGNAILQVSGDNIQEHPDMLQHCFCPPEIICTIKSTEGSAEAYP